MMAADLSSQPIQPRLDSQHEASLLEVFCSTKVSVKVTFIRQEENS